MLGRYAEEMVKFDLDLPKFIKKKREIFFEILAQTQLELYPGATDLVQTMLKRLHGKIALCKLLLSFVLSEIHTYNSLC